MDSLHQLRKRIVITGVGVISSAGLTQQEFWKNLTESDAPESTTRNPGEDGVRLGTSSFTANIDEFGELPDAKRKSIRKALKLMNRETQMGVAAGQLALLDTGAESDCSALEYYSPERFAVCFGADNVSIMPDDFSRGIQACSDAAGQFDIERWGEDGIGEVAPLWILKCLPNMPACHLAILNDLRGPSNTITQRDVSANMAVAEACRTIRSGDADAVLVGATGTMLTTFNLMHARLENEVAAAQESEMVCRPFDQRRSGSTPGEGAGAIVLEELPSALARGATIYGEVLGASSGSAIGPNRITACRTAMFRALSQTLRQSGRNAKEIGHLHAHGLGSRDSDIAEAQAIREIFGASTAKLPVVAAKSLLANSAAGAGMLELIASLLALKHNRLFPIRNYGVPDPDCPVNAVVRNDESAGSSFVNLNLFQHGLASCVAVGQYQGGKMKRVA